MLIDGRTGYVTQRNPAWEERHGSSPDDDSPVQLFDLKTGLAQKHNLAAAHPEVVAQLQALLRQLREQGYSAPRLQAANR